MTITSPSRKIGILGGSFNPVHLGHLRLAESAQAQFHLEQVLWVPTHYPTYKHQPLISFAQRWDMLELAIADHPHFMACDLERHRPTSSYASDTFAELVELFPQTSWYWIVGVDALRTLPRWKNNRDLISQCIWLVAPRNQIQSEAVCMSVEAELAQHSMNLQWHLIDTPELQISSSLIRYYCQIGRSLRYLVPESVRIYIHTNNLYQEPNAHA